MILDSDLAPKMGGAVAQGRSEEGFIWITGMVGHDPSSGDLVDGGFEAQLQQAITNLHSVLRSGGSSLARVVRAEIQYTRQGDHDAMNDIFRERFPAPRPARTSFGVPFLDERNGKTVLVQIDCIATAVSEKRSLSTQATLRRRRGRRDG